MNTLVCLAFVMDTVLQSLGANKPEENTRLGSQQSLLFHRKLRLLTGEAG